MGNTKSTLTVRRLYPQVVESDQRGTLDDDFDRLLPVDSAHVSLARRAFGSDGSIEGEVGGLRDVDTCHSVVVQLSFISKATTTKNEKTKI